MLPYYCLTDAQNGDVRRDYINIFLDKFPNFFENEAIRKLEESAVFDEMILPLRTWDAAAPECPYPNEAVYQWFDGDYAALQANVARVSPHWAKNYRPGAPIWCGMVDGKVASFCMVTDYGEYLFQGKRVRIGSIGCVGTVPEYRRRGIGLAMIHSATVYLKEQGYDFGYIHYTGPATHWYARLGYRSFVRWTKNGICENEE